MAAVTPINQGLLTQTRESIVRGLRWLRQHDAEIAQIQDLSAHYKAPYLYAAVGDSVLGGRYAHRIGAQYLQPDGDFRTGPADKGWSHLPCSPANRYLYSNGWIIAGLRRLGYYGAAARGIDFVRRFQSIELGGFASRFEPATGHIERHYLDSSSTSSAGLALLACGRVEEAARAGDFLLRLLDAQPHPDRFYYCSWETVAGLMTDVWGDEDANSVRGRKQFCLSAEADPRYELTWLIGKPMKFLARLYDQTGDRKYLEGSTTLFNFFHKLGDERWHNYASCKTMWASAELYRHTGEPRFAETAGRILSWFCESQLSGGLWVHYLWYRDEREQPLQAALDLVQELCAEMSDVVFDLSAAGV